MWSFSIFLNGMLYTTRASHRSLFNSMWHLIFELRQVDRSCCFASVSSSSCNETCFFLLPIPHNNELRTFYWRNMMQCTTERFSAPNSLTSPWESITISWWTFLQDFWIVTGKNHLILLTFKVNILQKLKFFLGLPRRLFLKMCWNQQIMEIQIHLLSSANYVNMPKINN